MHMWQTGPPDIARIAARACAGLVASVSCLLVLGWVLQLPWLQGALSATAGTAKLNAALSLLLSGASLFLYLGAKRAGKLNVTAKFCACVVIAIGATTFLEHALDTAWIDELLVRDSAERFGAPGRMAPTTALALVALGSALFLIDIPRTSAAFLLLALIPGVIGFVACLGYIFGVEPLYGIEGFSRQALSTALLLVIMSIAMLAARPDRGLVLLLMSDSNAGTMARRILPATIVIPIFVGWLRLLAERVGIVTTGGGVAAFVMTTIVVFFSTGLWSLRSVDIADRERSRVATQLRTSEAKFRALAQSAQEAIVSSDRAGNLTYFNPGAEVMFGHDARSVHGRPLTLLMPERLREAHLRGMARYLETSEPRVIGNTVELSGLRANATEFPIELSLSTWQEGNEQHFTAIIRDITDRKRVMHERDQFFSLSLDMLCIAGVDGYFKRLNPAFESTLGFPSEELTGKPFADFVHPDDRAATLAEVSKLASGLPAVRFENRYLCKDGGYKWLSWTASPDPGGVIYAVARDVTQQRAAAQQLAALARTDSLTGLANRRLLHETLDRLIAEAQRGRAFALLLLDVDHFKKLNDEHGHQAGDEALQSIARALEAGVRKTDLVARYGGEEFCILLTELAPHNAITLAEKLRVALELIQAPYRITASFGVCSYDLGWANTAETLLAAADKALYRAKRCGRNRVEAARADDLDQRPVMA